MQAKLHAIAGEFTRCMIADYLQLQVILCAIAGNFASAIARVFLTVKLVFLPANLMYFCLQKQAISHEFRM